MFAMTSYFSLPKDTNWDDMRKLARERAVAYQGMPGMRSKAFIVDPERGFYGANYVWETREDIERFMTTELWQGILNKLGRPNIHIMEVPAYLERGAIIPLDKKIAA